MKKRDLQNGDIVVTRGGELGVVIINGADDSDNYILYQAVGSDTLDLFQEDLTDVEDNPALDLMEVYRGQTFQNLDNNNGYPLWRREPGWNRPTADERRAMKELAEQKRQKQIEEEQEKAAAIQKRSIAIVAQAFYGNLTGTEILPEEIDRFILGHLNSKAPVSEPIDRTIIHIPGNDHAVLIYNQYQEAERLADGEKWLAEEGYVIKPLAEIPELDIKIFSRCIACGMDADGNLESLLEEDYDAVMRYLAK